jgi:small conductance mechanosensitive channel
MLAEATTQPVSSWVDKGYDLLIKYGPRVVGAILFLFAVFVVAGWAGRLTRKAMERAKVDATLSRFLGQIARWGVLALGFISCLSIFNVDVTSFAVLLGACGLAVGLALQGSLSNLAAGVMLLIFRPFKVSDVVVIGGQLGKIQEIDLFNTMMDTFDNRRIIVPNGTIFGATIENITHHPTRRVDIAVGVEYSADLDKTREVLTAAAAKVPDKLADPAPQIILLSLGNSSVDWQVRVWCKTEDYWTVWDAATKIVKQSLDEAGLGIPFPQMDVHLDKLGE